MPQTYSIRELAREFQITPRALRFYEDKQILSPQRDGARRVYSERDRTRLKLTLRGKRIGFSLEECLEIIDMYNPAQADGKADDTLQLLRLCQKIGQHRAALLGKMNDIEATLKTMAKVEQQCLDKLVRQAA